MAFIQMSEIVGVIAPPSYPPEIQEWLDFAVANGIEIVHKRERLDDLVAALGAEMPFYDGKPQK